MKAFWYGAGDNPTNTATRYANLCATPQGNFVSGEDNAVSPMTDEVVITKFTVWLATAPGAGNSWDITIRDDGADTAATVNISESGTTATWSGTLVIDAASLVGVGLVPTSTPTNAGRVQWIIEYETAGDFYLLPSNIGGAQSSDGSLFMPVVGGHNFTPSSAAREAIVPAGMSITALAARVETGGTNVYRVSKNSGASESETVTTSGTAVAVQEITPFACSAGDTIEIRQSDSSQPWTTHCNCLRIEPDTPGQIMCVMTRGANLVPSNTATEYAMPLGFGVNDWTATEADAQVRLPACTLKRLYASVDTAPSSGKSRAFTIRSNGSSTSVTCTIADTNTAANDTANATLHSDGDTVSIQMVPSGTPTGSGVTLASFIAEVEQPVINNTGLFFAMF